MKTVRKTILFVLQRSPYGSSAAREALDAALAAASFEQDVQLLFSGDGVWQLLPQQEAAAIGSKDIGKMLQALAYYDIETVYVDAVSLAERKLSAEQLALPAKLLAGEALQQLFRAADCVIAL